MRLRQAITRVQTRREWPSPLWYGDAPCIRRPDLSCRFVGSWGLQQMRAVVEQRHAGRLSFGRARPVSRAFVLQSLVVALAMGATVAGAQVPGATAPADSVAIRAAVKLEPATRIEGAQVSPLRATVGPQLGDAIACLKLA